MEGDKPIARWLTTARLSQTMVTPKGRRPWSQDHLLSLMKTEVGWAPYRPNYSRYENGRSTPEPEQLEKFTTFWKAHGVEPPDLTPAPVVAPVDLPTALSELAAELRATRQERRSLEARLRSIEAELQSLRAPQAAGASPVRSTPVPTAG